MGRLIEVQTDAGLPASLTIEVGDLLQFAASGGHVRSGAGVVEMLGPFLCAAVANNGQVLAPAGWPNTVLFLARGPGRATIDVVVGDPWQAPTTAVVAIDVRR